MSDLQLVIPSNEYEKSFADYAKEFKDAKEENYDLYKGAINNFAEYTKILNENASGINVPDDWVPQHTYWMINKDKEIVGIIRVRTSIEIERLRTISGHIGYDIKPSERRNGYGIKILSLGLIEAKKIGLDKVLITCDDDNFGSIKIIESNKGVYESDYYIKETKTNKLRYWIQL